MNTNNIKSVYIFGPIHIYGEDFLPVYKKLVSKCSERFEDVIGTYPDFWDTEETPTQFYNRTINTITKCDVFVAEVTNPSHGVGMELQMAHNNDIPIMALAEENEKISSMVVGNPAVVDIIRYKNKESLYESVPKRISDLS